MSKVALSGNALGSGTLTIAAPNTSTDRTLSLPDASGTILTTATPGVPVNGPAFSAYSSTGTVVANATFTKILFQAEDFDTNSNYDTSTSRFTPTVAGYYQFNWLAGAGTQAEKFSSLYKNGVAIKGGSDLIGYISSGSAVVYMNGSTDYVEVYFYQGVGTSTTSYAGTQLSGFSGALIRSAT